MQEYRVFILGSDDRVEASVNLLCRNDGEAIEAAKQLVDGHDVELWQRDRKIERFDRPGQQSSGPNLQSP
jgi:hypothetical protein